MPKRRHGYRSRSRGSSAPEAKEYSTWRCMRRRCRLSTRPEYRLYGGRGIRVCDRWLGPLGFDHFIADMGPAPSAEHTIDRIDPNGHYEPSNCRWASREVQANNKRGLRYIEVRGERLTLAQWARRLGVDRTAIYYRLQRGMSPELAVTTPSKRPS